MAFRSAPVVVIALLAAAPAPAADIPMQIALPAPDVLEASTSNGWTGFYLGALLGYGSGDADLGGIGSIDADGVQGGVYGGVNRQFGSFVLGVEGDVLGSALDGSEDGVSVDERIEGSLRARAGISLERFLVYGTAGGAAADVKLSGFGDEDRDVALGWTAGAGVEAMLTDRVTARVEYRYTDLEDQTFTLNGGDVNADLSTNAIRAGVGFRF